MARVEAEVLSQAQPDDVRPDMLRASAPEAAVPSYMARVEAEVLSQAQPDDVRPDMLRASAPEAAVPTAWIAPAPRPTRRP